MYKLCLFCLVFVFSLQLVAKGQVTGRVFDFEDKKKPLEYVVVRNLNNGQLKQTKADGSFTIAAKKGDLLSFTKLGYHIDTLFLVDLSVKNIYLPVMVNDLKQVDIFQVKMNPSIFTPDPEAKAFKRFETDGLRGKKNFDRAGGLKLNIGYGKYKKKELKGILLNEKAAVEDEINGVFTAEFVTALVKLSGQELKDFMFLYKPTAAQVEREQPFDYRFYTITSFHKWLKLPADRKKPPVLPVLKY